jgi:thiol-disulfide isomerase/thioredoxin
MTQTSHKSSRPPAKKPVKKPGRSASPSRAPFVVIGAAVVAAFVIAIVATRNSGSGDSNLAQTSAVTVTGSSLTQFADSGPDPAIGLAAPELRGTAFDGSPVTIANDGRPKIVIFIAHWCPHCQAEVPVITKWIAANGKPSGVDMYAVSTGVSKDQPNYPPSAWLKRENWPLTTLADSADAVAAQAFGLSAYPFFTVVNAAGKVVLRATGELDTTKLAQLVTVATS